jgi:hypothetical protein
MVRLFAGVLRAAQIGHQKAPVLRDELSPTVTARTLRGRATLLGLAHGRAPVRTEPLHDAAIQNVVFVLGFHGFGGGFHHPSIHRLGVAGTMEEFDDDLQPDALPMLYSEPGSSVTYCTDDGLLTLTMPGSGRICLPFATVEDEAATREALVAQAPDADELRIIRNYDGRIAMATLTLPEPEAA